MPFLRIGGWLFPVYLGQETRDGMGFLEGPTSFGLASLALWMPAGFSAPMNRVWATRSPDVVGLQVPSAGASDEG